MACQHIQKGVGSRVIQLTHVAIHGGRREIPHESEVLLRVLLQSIVQEKRCMMLRPEQSMKHWRHLETSGDIWRHLETSGDWDGDIGDIGE